jgi:hypothetical protein
MTASEALNSQDWYRVRRGEDEIAWGRTHEDPELPTVIFSRRSQQELAFLEPEQQEAVRQCLRDLGDGAAPVTGGQGRRVVHVDALRIVYRVDPGTNRVMISTIRGGKVCDPENVGPAPGS